MKARELILQLQDFFREGQIDDMYLEIQRETQGAFIGKKDEFNDGWKTIDHEEDDRLPKSPYPGLRPFRTTEASLFFGREDLENDILSLLADRRLVAVTGSSGTGKSSLIRAGLIPKLHWGRLRNKTGKWRVTICRPGLSPLENLGISLTCSRLFSSITAKAAFSEDLKELHTRINNTLRESQWGLMELEEEVTKDSHNSLIIIDQFEEIFRFKKETEGTDREKEADFFIQSLINATSLAFENNIYVILTMRSEFLGDCVQFKGLTETINKGQYLIPKLTPLQIQAAIEKPARVEDTKVSPLLTKKLVEAIRDNQDQLPVLQHLLMRCYQHWCSKKEPTPSIDIEDYKAVGGIADALNWHADSIYKGLDKKGKEAIEIILKTITDHKGIRRPVKFQEIKAIAAFYQVEESHLKAALEKFGSPECSFTYPSSNSKIQPKTMIDISHESLMRLWGTLKEWIKEEQRAGEEYEYIQNDRSYSERQSEENHRENNWMEGQRASLFYRWWNNKNPGMAWAKRYHRQVEFKKEIDRLKDRKGIDKSTTIEETEAHLKIYAKNKNFLFRSYNNYQEELKKDLIDQQSKQKRMQIWQILISIVLTAALIFLIGFLEERGQNEELEIEKEQLRQLNIKYQELVREQDNYIANRDFLLDSVNFLLDSVSSINAELKTTQEELASALNISNQQTRLAEEKTKEATEKQESLEELLIEYEITKKLSDDLTEENRIRDSITLEIISKVNQGINHTDPNESLKLLFSAEELRVSQNVDIDPFITYEPLSIIYEEETFYEEIMKLDDCCTEANFSFNADYFLVENNSTSRIYETKSQEQKSRFPFQLNNPKFIEGGQGDLFYLNDGTLFRTQLSNDREPIEIERNVSIYDFSQSGDKIASGTEHRIGIYDYTTQKQVNVERGSPIQKASNKKIAAIASGPVDGAFLIRFRDNTLFEINQKQEKIYKLQKKSTYDIFDDYSALYLKPYIQFSPRGQYLIMNDPIQRLTNLYLIYQSEINSNEAVKNAIERGNYLALNGNVKALAFSEDERYLAVIFESGGPFSAEKEVKILAPEIWDLDKRELRYLLKSRFLNEEEELVDLSFKIEDGLTSLYTISNKGRMLKWLVDKPDLESEFVRSFKNKL